MHKVLLVVFGCCIFSVTFGQSDSNEVQNNFRLYIDTYYGAQFGLFNTDQKELPDFIFSHHRHNEVNLNLGLLHFSHNSNRVRGNFGVMAGTYANRNLADEPGVLKNIYEANAGVRLTENHALWLDMGVMESHIGFESAITQEQNFMTRSILAENSPYYSAGVDLNYTTANEKFLFSLLALNGWQTIAQENTGSFPAVGHRFYYQPNEALSINSSSYFGREQTAHGLRNRIFHNLYAKIENEAKGINAIFGLDYGLQRDSSSGWNEWVGVVMEAKKELFNHFAFASRLEYFYDAGNTIIPYGTFGLFENIGATLSIAYAPVDNVLLRLESRNYIADGAYYRMGEEISPSFWYVGFALLLRVNWGL